MLEYHAAYFQSREDDGWYIADVLDFPGVFSQGKTLKSARWMIRDALRLMLEWYLKDGKPLPRPNPRARRKRAKFTEKIRVQVRLSRKER